MQRLVALFVGLLMLALALVPALPTYVCTDGGRSLNPCSLPETRELQPDQSSWNLEDCCKLTSALIKDARPPEPMGHSERVATKVYLTATVPAARTETRWFLSSSHPERGEPPLRGPPLHLHSVLRI